ncbi:hypothetical protein BBY84_10515 [Salmonella enterica]|nr:hypothetical protein [Salmonella enterica]ECI8012283.1 hypothetical protein [Salmonella enterica subsp. enterica]HEC8153395.1 hypothetical protein [Salmonella enterica subsp. enterica serovar Mississippi]EEP7894854.1 hypothetical protein [Salmonella enterica]EJU7421648.1 hypothetical protein [Salmonella enterica]
MSNELYLKSVEIIPSIKSEYVSKINEYAIITFNEGLNDACCIMRIMEINQLNKLRKKGAVLYSLTGLPIPEPKATAEEINLLLNHFSQICRREEEELSFRQRELSKAEAVKTNAGSKSSGSIAEAMNKVPVRAARAEAERCYNIAASRLAEQRDRLDILRHIPGLLASEAEHIGKGIDKRLLHSYPASQNIPAGLMSVINDSKITSGINFILEQLNTLSKAVNEIVSLCSIPSDKYVLNNGGMARALAYREYYKSDHVLLRAVVTDRDYVEHVVKNNLAIEYKNKLFS